MTSLSTGQAQFFTTKKLIRNPFLNNQSCNNVIPVKGTRGLIDRLIKHSKVSVHRSNLHGTFGATNLTSYQLPLLKHENTHKPWKAASNCGVSRSLEATRATHRRMINLHNTATSMLSLLLHTDTAHFTPHLHTLAPYLSLHTAPLSALIYTGHQSYHITHDDARWYWRVSRSCRSQRCCAGSNLPIAPFILSAAGAASYRRRGELLAPSLLRECYRTERRTLRRYN